MKMKLKILLGLILSVMVFQVSAQDLTYDIILRNKPVGQIQASKTSTKDGIDYSLESQASFSLIFNINYNYLINTSFSDNMLTKAFAENTVNDKIKASSSTKKTGELYEIQLLEDGKKVMNMPITYSMINLYFSEPSGIDKVYSERYGKFLEISSLGNSKYKVILPDNREITYCYDYGQCVEIKVDHTLANIYFKLRDPDTKLSAN